jgi:hypothetical protein
VADWYDTVYVPVAQAIRDSGILREFPHRTEADLYRWLTEHEWFLRQSGALDDDVPREELARSYAQEFSERPIRRLTRAVRRRARRVVEGLADGASEGPDSSAAPDDGRTTNGPA